MASKPRWPESGDLVIATVKRITDYGAYVQLDEYYGQEGLLHVSEVASGWVRNIKDFVREGQKTVLKVLRVNTEKGQVDVSLRRVSRIERREKLLSWKRERKAEGIMRSVSEKIKMSFDEVLAKTGTVIEDKFGGIYEGLETAAKEGPEPLLKVGLPKDLVDAIVEVAKDKIKLPMVKIKGELQLQCFKPNGIIHIREALLNVQKIERPKGTNVNLYVIAAPKYAVEVLAGDYKEAEKLLQEAAEAAIKIITKAGGTGSFQRGK
jgi:translation initiation factor 2 subunit 1